jgi:hypothetical protein
MPELQFTPVSPAPAQSGGSLQFTPVGAPSGELRFEPVANPQAPDKADSYTSKYQSDIVQAALRYGIKPSVALAIHRIEDAQDDPNAVSPTKHVGMYQMSVDAWKQAGMGNPQDRTDPLKNIEGGMKYFHQLLMQNNGDYNRAVQHFGDQTPEYMKKYQEYVKQYDDVGLTSQYQEAASEAGFAVPKPVTQFLNDPKSLTHRLDKADPALAKLGHHIPQVLHQITKDHPSFIEHVSNALSSLQRGAAGARAFEEGKGYLNGEIIEHPEEWDALRKQVTQWVFNPAYQERANAIDRAATHDILGVPSDAQINAHLHGPLATGSRAVADTLSQILGDPLTVVPVGKGVEALTGISKAAFGLLAPRVGVILNHAPIIATVAKKIGDTEIATLVTNAGRQAATWFQKRPDLDVHFNKTGKKIYMGIVTGQMNADARRVDSFRKTAADMTELQEPVAQMFADQGDAATKAFISGTPTAGHLLAGQRLIAARDAAQNAAQQAWKTSQQATARAKALGTQAAQAAASQAASAAATAAAHLQKVQGGLGSGAFGVEKYVATLKELAQRNAEERVEYLRDISTGILKKTITRQTLPLVDRDEYLSAAAKDTKNLLGRTTLAEQFAKIDHDPVPAVLREIEKSPIGKLFAFFRTNSTKILAYTNPGLHPIKNVGALAYLRAPSQVAGGTAALITGITHGLSKVFSVGKLGFVPEAVLKEMERVGARTPYYSHDIMQTLKTPFIGPLLNTIRDFGQHVEDGYRAAMFGQLNRAMAKMPKDPLLDYLKGQIVNERAGDYHNLTMFARAFRSISGPFVAFRLGIVPEQVTKSLFENPSRLNNQYRLEINENQEQRKGGYYGLYHVLGGPGTDEADIAQNIAKFMASPATLGVTGIGSNIAGRASHQSLEQTVVDSVYSIIDLFFPGFGAILNVSGLTPDYDAEPGTSVVTRAIEHETGTYGVHTESKGAERAFQRDMRR